MEKNMQATVRIKNTSKFDIDGIPPLREALPLGLRHVLAMFVGNIVPMILVAKNANMSPEQGNLLLQCSMLGAAISTLIQLYPLKFKGGLQIGSGLPCFLGLTYVFLPACLSISATDGIAVIFGAQIIAGLASAGFGLGIKYVRKFFPPVVTGTIVMTVGISIFNLAIGNVAGGPGTPDFGSLKNWGVGVLVVVIVLGFNVFGKGLPKVASILIGMISGYIVALCLGMVDFSGVGSAAWFAIPTPFAFGLEFKFSVIVTFLILYFIVAVQMIGDFSVSCMGGMNREPSDEELSGAIIGNGLSSALSACFNNFPTATYSQNSGIVALTKVCSRYVIGVGAVTLLIAGFCPKIGAVLSTIPNPVIGGGTLVVFSMIATSGMRLVAQTGFSNRNCLIIGVSLAFGLGTQFCLGASSGFPQAIATMLEKNSVILTTLLAITLNMIFPQDVQEKKDEDEEQKKLA